MQKIKLYNRPLYIPDVDPKFILFHIRFIFPMVENMVSVPYKSNRKEFNYNFPTIGRYLSLVKKNQRIISIANRKLQH